MAQRWQHGCLTVVSSPKQVAVSIVWIVAGQPPQVLASPFAAETLESLVAVADRLGYDGWEMVAVRPQATPQPGAVQWPAQETVYFKRLLDASA